MKIIKNVIMLFSGLLCMLSIFLFTYQKKNEDVIDDVVIFLETKNDNKEANTDYYSYVVPVVNRKEIKVVESNEKEDGNLIEKTVIDETVKEVVEQENEVAHKEDEVLDETNDMTEPDVSVSNEQVVSLENSVIENEQDEASTELNQDEVTSESMQHIVSLSNDIISEEKGEVLTVNPLKNGFITEENKTYYYEDDVKVTGLKNIDGVNHYFAPNGTYLGTNNVKVIDVSHHQGKIDWDKLSREAEIYGVIIRAGYWNTLDREFYNNISAVKRLNIPYGIYFYSYASSVNGAKKEGEFARKVIIDYDLHPTLGIYYDIESWRTSTSSSDAISKELYDKITSTFVNEVKALTNEDYKVKLYSGRWYAMNRLGIESKALVDWVAEYNETCKYDGSYSLWQYTSSGSMPGITGRVDISYLK